MVVGVIALEQFQSLLHFWRPLIRKHQKKQKRDGTEGIRKYLKPRWRTVAQTNLVEYVHRSG